MKISLNKIKSYVSLPADSSDDELVKLIGSRLVEIEEVIDLAPAYQGIYIAKVVKAEPIPGTHLHLCEIDAGEHNAEFKQLENGFVQVVCGAPNVHAGMLAVWITPGAIVPETYGAENFKLSVRKLQGYESNGMLAGPDELGLGGEHKAIAEIAPTMAQPGDRFADVFDLNDKILDVENKSLTHRPDCFGLIGFAREVAGILGLEFTEPDLFQQINRPLQTVAASDVKIRIADPELCPRYTCAVFELSDNQPSKYLTPEAVFLAKAGMRTVDPMVDLTNILMLETGQPLHAFDYDKLIAVGGKPKAEIIVRAARDGEELQLLDGKTIQLADFDIVITSNDIPVALAGAMGGKNTEIDASTHRVILESATFSLYHLRKTQMAHGIFSEAITRFTKGQPAALCSVVLEAALAELKVTPLAVNEAYPAPQKPVVVKITTDEINGLLGTHYDATTIVQTLESVGFAVESDSKQPSFSGTSATNEERAERPEPRNDGRAGACPEKNGCYCQTACLKVTSPAWRTDIHIAEDVIEEVGRLLGYDNITLTLPTKPFIEAELDPMLRLKRQIRQTLSHDLNMHELLTYSFVSCNLIEKVNQDPTESYEIVNSISPELQCFRQHIVPSLLDKVRENLKAGHRAFMLYEQNQVTTQSAGQDSDGAPQVATHLGIVDLHDFYHLKAQILALLRHKLKLDFNYRPFACDSATAKAYPYLEPAHSAELVWQDQVIGAFGELKAGVLQRFKLADTTVSALELSLDPLAQAQPELQVSVQLSKFPSVERDLTLRLAADVAYWRVFEMLETALRGLKLLFTVTPLSIYQAATADATKNLSFHLKFSSPDHTLTPAEISAIMDKIAQSAAELGATII